MRGFIRFVLIAAASFGLFMSGVHADDDERKRSRGKLNVEAAKGIKDSESKAFFVTLEEGEEKTIATAGPLEVFARCIAANVDTVEVLVQSSVAGWFESTTSPGGPIEADIPVGLFVNTANSGTQSYTENIDEFSVIGPDEKGRLFYVSIDGDTVGLGLNLFEHRCLVVGTVTVAKLRDTDGRRRWKRGDSDDDD